MPVYEQGYETYSGERRSLNRRWWPLFREEILPYFRRIGSYSYWISRSFTTVDNGE